MTIDLFPQQEDDPEPAPDPTPLIGPLDKPPVLPAEDREWVRVSELSVYLEWLDEVRKLLARHGDESVEAWMRPVVPADLAAEIRAIADDVEQLGDDLRDIADAVEHAEHWTEQKEGGRR